MNGFLNYFLAPLDPATLHGLLRASAELSGSAHPYFWFVVVVLARFVLPDIGLWLWRLVQPHAFTPPLWRGGREWPRVTVLIAGRDCGDSLMQTIHSVLRCGYPNLEVIYIDDHSSDDSVARARLLEKTGRIRVFESSQHNGKPSSLNIGIAMAQGEYILVLDADSELQQGSIPHLLAQFSDAQVGAVAANLRVRNASSNLVTRFQECEYALNVSLSRIWRARFDLLSILPGAGSMFRTRALRQLGGYDTGLGDDTDLTLRLRKRGWKLGFALGAVVWTDVPDNYAWLLRQRSRWTRNMVKIRLHKQGDLFRVWRFGLANGIVHIDGLLFRVLLPLVAVAVVLHGLLSAPFTGPLLLTGIYWITVGFLLVKLLIAHDIAATPRLKMLWLAFLYPFYRLPVHLVELASMLREFLRIKLWHPYVPQRIWQRIPHW